METNRTDKDILVKGLKLMAISLALMFLGPSLIYIAFNNPEKPLYYPLLIAGVIGCISAGIVAYKGLNTIMNSMFKKK
ncbi:MAG: DUF6095 family protein [Oceanihabitans sp.]